IRSTTASSPRRHPPMPETACPMVRAREAAGLTLEQAAKKARVSKGYLKRFEGRGGGPPEVLAKRLRGIYKCPIDVFLPTGGRIAARLKSTKGGQGVGAKPKGGRGLEAGEDATQKQFANVSDEIKNTRRRAVKISHGN